MKDLAIIVLCYNSRKHVPICLRSLHSAIHGMDARVYLVDNASSDNTVDYVQREFGWCKVIRSHSNEGYSFGNNLGLKAAGFPDGKLFSHVMLLNPDTVVPPNALRTMLQYIQAHPNIGVLGPKLLLADGTLDKACKRGSPTPATAFYHFSGLARLFPRSQLFGRYNMTFVDPNETADIDSTVGACQMIRGQALSQVGLLDEQFFMYGEDLDINLRIRQAGYRVVYYPRVIVHHLKGSSTRKEPDRMIRSFYDSMKLFHRKHFSLNHSPLFNHIVYISADFICRYKLIRNRLKPPSRRAVGSAPE